MTIPFVIRITLLCVVYHALGFILSLSILSGVLAAFIYLGPMALSSAVGLAFFPFQTFAGIWALRHMYFEISNTCINRLSNV
jgi:hypothetical protein